MTDRGDFQLECLARWVLSQHSTRGERLACLDRIESKRGKPFADRLRAAVNAELQKRRKK